jgi:hypothetical protein
VVQAEIARQPRDLIRGHLPGNAPRRVVKPVRQQGFTLGKDASALGMRRYRDIGLTEELQNCVRPDVLDPAVTVDPNRYGVFFRQKEMRQRLEASCVLCGSAKTAGTVRSCQGGGAALTVLSAKSK